MTLGSNGIAALRLLGAADRVVDAGFARIDASEDGSTPSHTLKRSDLYRAIRDEAIERGLPIEYDKRLVDAVTEAGGVRAYFSDGSTAVADILIGCDGVRSTVRRLIDPNAPAPAYTGLIGTGGYTRDLAVDTEPGAYEMIFGKRAFLGYAAEPGGGVRWFANVPQPTEPAPGEAEFDPTRSWRERLCALYRDDAGPGSALVEVTESILPMSPISPVHSNASCRRVGRESRRSSSRPPESTAPRPLARSHACSAIPSCRWYCAAPRTRNRPATRTGTACRGTPDQASTCR